MTRRTLSSDALSRPSGVFVHGVSVADARLVFVSGMLARDRSGRIVGPGDVAAQTHQCLRNIQAVLALEGASLEDIVKVTVYVRDMGHFETIHEVRARYFTGDRVPASTMVEVSRFTEDDALVEIEAVAAVPVAPRQAGDEE